MNKRSSLPLISAWTYSCSCDWNNKQFLTAMVWNLVESLFRTVEATITKRGEWDAQKILVWYGQVSRIVYLALFPSIQFDSNQYLLTTDIGLKQLCRRRFSERQQWQSLNLLKEEARCKLESEKYVKIVVRTYCEQESYYIKMYFMIRQAYTTYT